MNESGTTSTLKNHFRSSKRGTGHVLAKSTKTVIASVKDTEPPQQTTKKRGNAGPDSNTTKSQNKKPKLETDKDKNEATDKSLRRSREFLRLPSTYETLEKIFQALETVMMFVKSKNEICIFHKIKKSVEGLCRRTFDLTRLAQIISVYPEAYTYKPIRHFHQDKFVLSYVIDFNTIATSESSSKASSSAFMVSTRERKKVFRNRLIELVKLEQTKFLKRQNIKEEKTEAIRLWHPEFVLNSVPEIVPVRLPQIDITTNDLTNATKQASSITAKHSITPVINKSTPPPIPSKPSGDTKAREKAILDRIREKERQAAQRKDATTLPIDKQKRLMLSRLPDMINTISYLFTSSDKDVMVLHRVAEIVSDSYSRKLIISKAEAEDHIRLVSTCLPDWCTVFPVQNKGTFVKIKRSIPMTEVKSKLVECLKKEGVRE